MHNKAEEIQSVTSLAASPDQDRDERFKKYAIAMGIRTVCVVLLVFVEGWMLAVVALGAIFLPYFAVVSANIQGAKETKNPNLVSPIREIT
jgi:cell division septal protein FtsQ